MPNPTQSDLHVNAPLTNVIVAYMQDKAQFIADKVFPRVPVQKQSDMYWKYSKSDWRRTDAQKRAPGTESPGVGWKRRHGQLLRPGLRRPQGHRRPAACQRGLQLEARP